MDKGSKDPSNLPVYFHFFNEIGIIEQLSRAFMEARLPDGFLISHFGVLNHLIRLGDGRTPLDIAKAFQIPKTSMTHTLAGLEKHKLVEMRPNPKDGRSKLVYLTEAGRKFRDDAIFKLVPDFQILQETIPIERVAEVLPLLSEVRIFLDELRNEK